MAQQRIRIVTFNVYMNKCRGPATDFLDINKDLQQKVPVLVFTQEDSDQTETLRRLNAVYNGGFNPLCASTECGPGQTVGCYYANMSTKQLKCDERFAFAHHRCAICVTVYPNPNPNKRVIRICNLHLNGGRNTDRELLLFNFDDMLENKLAILKL